MHPSSFHQQQYQYCYYNNNNNNDNIISCYNSNKPTTLSQVSFPSLLNETSEVSTTTSTTASTAAPSSFNYNNVSTPTLEPNHVDINTIADDTNMDFSLFDSDEELAQLCMSFIDDSEQKDTTVPVRKVDDYELKNNTYNNRSIKRVHKNTTKGNKKSKNMFLFTPSDETSDNLFPSDNVDCVSSESSCCSSITTNSKDTTSIKTTSNPSSTAAAPTVTPITMPVINMIPNNGNSSAAAPQSQTGFVNVMLMVDPVTHTVTMLPQTLQYQDQTCTVQATELSTFPKETIDMFTQQVIMMQQQQQNNNNSNSSVATSPAPTSSAAAAPVSPSPSMESPSSSTVSVSSSTVSSSTTVPTSSGFLSGKLSKSTPSTTSGSNGEKGMLPPLRALSAYNFFFRDERERLLEERNTYGHLLDSNVHRHIVRDMSPSKQEKLLNDHWYRDRHAKRRHRKSDGKIAFAELSRRISASWKKLDDQYKEFYKVVAAKDWERYQRESQEYKMYQEDQAIIKQEQENNANKDNSNEIQHENNNDITSTFNNGAAMSVVG